MFIRLMGDVSVQVGEEPPLQLTRTQAHVAFARLTLERRERTSRDQLADSIWPDGLPATWPSALRSIVSRVRTFVASTGATDGDVLVSHEGWYRFDLPADTRVDVEVAKQAAQDARDLFRAEAFDDAIAQAEIAIGHLRGAFLPDHDGEWVAGLRDTQEELLVASLEVAGRAANELGRHQLALDFADEAIRRQPLRESAHRCRMLTQLRAGNRAEALTTYQRLRRMLAEELGVDPSSETEDLYIDVLGHGPSTSATVAPAMASVGREAEREQVTSVLQSIASSGARFVLLQGEPGSGKTQLVTDLAREAVRDGTRVLFGTSIGTIARPLGPIIGALGTYLASTPDDGLPRFNRVTREMLGPLLTSGDRAALLEIDSSGVFTALVEAFRSVSANRPLVVVLDGIDRADDVTITFVRELLQRCTSCPLLLIGTADALIRSGTELAEAMHDLEVAGVGVRIRLDGLDRAEVHELARSSDVLPPGSMLSDALLARTGGNPFLLGELMRAWSPETGFDCIPASVHEYARRRVGILRFDEADFIRYAACAGMYFNVEVVARVARIDPPEAHRLCSALRSTGLVASLEPGLRTGSTNHRFRHDVVRRSIYEQEQDGWRRDVHGRVADAIEEIAGDDPSTEDIRAIAQHRLLGGQAKGTERAVRWAWRAAQTMDGVKAVELCTDALARIPAEQPELRALAAVEVGLAERRIEMPGWDDRLCETALEALAQGQLETAARAVLGLTGAGNDLRADVIVDRILRADASGTADGITDHTVGRLVASRARVRRDVDISSERLARSIGALSEHLRTLTGPCATAERGEAATDLAMIADLHDDDDARAVAAHHAAMAAALQGDLAGTRDALKGLELRAIHTWVADELLHDASDCMQAACGPYGASIAAPRRDRELFSTTGPAQLVELDPGPGKVGSHQALVDAWLNETPLVRAVDPMESVDEPLAWAGEALAALLRGERSRAHVHARGLMHSGYDFDRLDVGSHIAALLAIVTCELEDERTAEQLRGILRPYADMMCGIGYRTFAGPMALHLGRLAMLKHDWADAEIQLERAILVCSEYRAMAWLGLAQRSLADVLDQRAGGSDTWADQLRLEADVAQSARLLNG